MSLRGVDLNLLPVLQALLRQGGVSGAARVLGMSQPAASHALGRLRHLIGDPLLVKVGREMRLTKRAEQLRPEVDSICAAVTATLSPEVFVPEKAQRDFVIATPDYMALLLGRALMPLLRETAPGVSIRFVDVGADFRSRLLARETDVAIVAQVATMLDGLSLSDGYREDLVCVAPPGHPLAGKGLVSASELAVFPMLGVDAKVPALGAGVAALFAGARQPVAVGPSHLLALPLLAAQSGSLAIVPRALARLSAEFVEAVILPLADAGDPLDLRIAWSPVEEVDPGHVWLRAVLSGLMAANFVRLE